MTKPIVVGDTIEVRIFGCVVSEFWQTAIILRIDHHSIYVRFRNGRTLNVERISNNWK